MTITNFVNNTTLYATDLNTPFGQSLAKDGSDSTMTGTLLQGTSAAPLANIGAISGAGVVDSDLGGYSILQYRTTVNPKADGSGPAVDAYSIYSGVTVQAIAPASGGTIIADSGQHIALVGRVDRYLPPSGATQPTTSVPMAQIWSFYGVASDHTGLPSSYSGALTFCEADLSANGADDGKARFGYVGNFQAATTIANGGEPAGLAYMFFCNSVDNDSIVYSQFYGAASYAAAVFDSRAAVAETVGVTGTVAVAATLGATSVVVSDVRPFLCGGDAYNSPLSPTNPVYNVLIGANRYTVNATTITAGQKGGTITLASGLVNGTDGEVGSVYGRVPAALWMQTGQQIVFDAQSNYRLGYDTNAGRVHLTGIGGLLIDNGITAGSVSTADAIITGGTIAAQAVIAAPRTVSANFTVTAADHNRLIAATAVPITGTIAAGLPDGFIARVCDATGSASPTAAITLDLPASNTIAGQSTFAVSTAYASGAIENVNGTI